MCVCVCYVKPNGICSKFRILQLIFNRIKFISIRHRNFRVRRRVCVVCIYSRGVLSLSDALNWWEKCWADKPKSILMFRDYCLLFVVSIFFLLKIENWKFKKKYFQILTWKEAQAFRAFCSTALFDSDFSLYICSNDEGTSVLLLLFFIPKYTH